MKKTLVIAIVLALVFAIAAPAFAVTPIKLSAKLEMGPVTADDEFVTGEDEHAAEEAAEALILTISIEDVTAEDNVCGGSIDVAYDATKLDEIGFRVGDGGKPIFGSTVVNDTQDGAIKIAAANASPAKKGGAIAQIAFKFDKAALAGQTVAVELKAYEWVSAESTPVEVGTKEFKAEYTFEGTAPTTEPTTEPTADPSGDASGDADNSGETPVAPTTGAASLAVVAVVSIVAGLGALALRKED